MELGNEVTLRSIVGGGKIPFNQESYMRGVELEAKFAGFDPRSLVDRRTDGDKIADTWREIKENPDEALFQVFDANLQLIVKTGKKSVDMTQQAIDLWSGKDKVDPVELESMKAQVARGKAMISRCEEVLRLRELIRTPMPKVQTGIAIAQLNAYEAANPLLYMLYTHRTNTADHGQVADDGTQTRILQIGRHHAIFAAELWIGRGGHFIDRKMGVIRKGETHWDGMIFIVHPGCGKTELTTATLERLICANPSLQSVYLHAVEKEASNALGYIQNAFLLDNDVGRRREALFPGLHVQEKNKKVLRLELKQRMKSPTITASGVSAKVLGANTDIQVFDDVVPQSDRDQEAERTRRKSTLGGQWETRQRGKAFRIIIGTLWHQDDYLAWMKYQAEREKIKYLVCALPAGGPNDNPPFKAVWPEIYPAKKLRDLYNKMPDRTVYDCAYRIDTASHESRIIKSLRYYDPFSEEHTRFMRGVRTYVTADPSATAEARSDRAGLMYVAVGDAEVQRTDASVISETQARIIDAKSLNINQPDLVQAVIDYGLQRAVDEVHIETVGGFHGTADFMEQAVEGLIVFRHQTGNKNKGTRLRMCASLIDNSMPGLSAKVLFPGEKKPDGSIGPCDDWTRLYDQFTKFGQTGAKEFADAGSQLFNQLQKDGILVAGEGQATTLIRKAVQSTDDPRIVAMLDAANRNARGGPPAAAEEVNWEQTRWLNN